MGVYLGSNAVDMQGGFVTGGASGASLQSKTVSPSESAQTVKADNGYDGLSQVTVNAVSKTYVGSGVTKKSAATYTPGTSDQNIASGQYLNGTQTIKGDSNLTAANIKSGVKIFNVTAVSREQQWRKHAKLADQNGYAQREHPDGKPGQRI